MSQPESDEPASLERLMAMLEQLIQQVSLVLRHQERSIDKATFTVKELALRTGRAEFTCRAWCRNRRVLATRLRGKYGVGNGWRVSREEVERLEKEGLRPPSEGPMA